MFHKFKNGKNFLLDKLDKKRECHLSAAFKKTYLVCRQHQKNCLYVLIKGHISDLGNERIASYVAF